MLKDKGAIFHHQKLPFYLDFACNIFPFLLIPLAYVLKNF